MGKYVPELMEHRVSPDGSGEPMGKPARVMAQDILADPTHRHHSRAQEMLDLMGGDEERIATRLAVLHARLDKDINDQFWEVRGPATAESQRRAGTLEGYAARGAVPCALRPAQPPCIGPHATGAVG